MQSFTPTGGIAFRTKLLPEAVAAAFCRCLLANPDFTAVTVQESGRSSNLARFFVTFLPANPERAAEMVQREHHARQQRADTEGAAYHFCLDKDGGRAFHWCFNPASGETYETTPHSCTCPDHHYRGAAAGVPCKHMLRLRQVLGTPAAAATFEPVRVTDRAEILRRMAQDFPD